VELASQQIAERHSNNEFSVVLSRLSEIESHGAVPNIYKLYSLCCIYRLQLTEVLSWYGVPVDFMAPDVALAQAEKTHPLSINPDGVEVTLPIALDPGIDLRKTSFISELVQRWGKLPLALLGGADVRRFKYAFVGSEDWSMSPTIPPGALLVIDDSSRRIQLAGWKDQSDRPIYFIGARDGYYCRWCSLRDGQVSLIPHPASDAPVLTFPLEEIDVIGRVVGLAISLDSEKRPHNRV
jgi:hypothetical protein